MGTNHPFGLRPRPTVPLWSGWAVEDWVSHGMRLADLVPHDGPFASVDLTTCRDVPQAMVEVRIVPEAVVDGSLDAILRF